MLRLRPVTLKEARRFVGRNHRHSRPPKGGLFAVGAEDAEGALRAAAIVGRPLARLLDDGYTCEVTRLCSDGARNACSMLYAAAARAAKALGYRRVVTYVLASESGASLLAAGWERDAEVPAEETWSRPSRPRLRADLFGDPIRPEQAKVRWVKHLSGRR